MTSAIAGLLDISCDPSRAGFTTAPGNLGDRMQVSLVKSTC
jgi:hypothetical protein